MDPVRLFKNHMNSIGFWDIWGEGNIIHIRHATTINGKALHHVERVLEGKQGRSIEEQVQHRIQSRINKQLDKGYVRKYEEAKKPPTNALNLFQPMLAQSLKRVPNLDVDKHYVQCKYDGHRCLITKQNGIVTAYSRQGKPITTVEHILEDMDIPEGMTFDGELYAHGESLQTIASWAKRMQDDTAKLKYIVYDVIEDSPYENRHQWLVNDFEYNIDGNVIVAPTWKLKQVSKTLMTELRDAKALGYEGLILRNERTEYQSGRRSRGLVKVKSCMDAEFPVIDIIPSKHNWAILVCQLPNGLTFKVSAPGSISDKAEVLRNKNDYIGKIVTVEFAEYTNDKKPFHAVALRFREDI